MFCNTQSPISDAFQVQTDPLAQISDSSDDEPKSKCQKLDYESSVNLKIVQLPSYKTIYPTSPSTLPKFVNNPLNLANPLALTSLLKKPQNRYSLPSLSKTLPSVTVQNKSLNDLNGSPIRYKKNGEVAKKRGPPKGYKRKPKTDSTAAAIQNLTNNLILRAQNNILTSLLASTSGLLDKKDTLDPKNLALLNKSTSLLQKTGFLSQKTGLLDKKPSLFDKKKPIIVNKNGLLGKAGLLSKDIARLLPKDVCVSPQLTIVSQFKVPEGVELVELDLDPADWFPNEPYRMVFSRKKNPKWKDFPFKCEYCFKGYRVETTLISHCSTRHGILPRQLAIPCPCCPHVSAKRRLHNAHLHTHSTFKGRLYCVYCVPTEDPNEPFVKVSEKYSYKKFPQYWYASEESLRLHKKRKHPYAAMFNCNWFCNWGDCMPNS